MNPEVPLDSTWSLTDKPWYMGNKRPIPWGAACWQRGRGSRIGIGALDRRNDLRRGADDGVAQRFPPKTEIGHLAPSASCKLLLNISSLSTSDFYDLLIGINSTHVVPPSLPARRVEE
jgi:hypothetical protein